MFDEKALLADIIEKWGAHGAHADLVRSMIASLERMRERVNELERENEHLRRQEAIRG